FDDKFANGVIVDFGHAPPMKRKLGQSLHCFKNALNHSGGIVLRVPCNVVADLGQVVHRFRRPDYFVRHVVSFLLTSSSGLPRPSSMDFIPFLTFSMT